MVKSKRRKKRTYNFQTRIMGALRQVFFRSPVRKEAVKQFKTQGGWACKECGKVQSKPLIDHVVPVVDIEKGFDTRTVINRLFGFKSGTFEWTILNLQNLCESCHLFKCRVEKAKRTIAKIKREGGK